MEKLQISPGCDESALKRQVSNFVFFLTLKGFSLALVHSAHIPDVICTFGGNRIEITPVFRINFAFRLSSPPPGTNICSVTRIDTFSVLRCFHSRVFYFIHESLV